MVPPGATTVGAAPQQYDIGTPTGHPTRVLAELRAAMHSAGLAPEQNPAQESPAES
jgi:hypothetical protein